MTAAMPQSLQKHRAYEVKGPSGRIFSVQIEDTIYDLNTVTEFKGEQKVVNTGISRLIDSGARIISLFNISAEHNTITVVSHINISHKIL